MAKMAKIAIFLPKLLFLNVDFDFLSHPTALKKKFIEEYKKSGPNVFSV
jgi:hypothetical protein